MKEEGNGTNGKRRRTIADLSPDAITLRKRLETLAPGDSVTYAELTKLIGGDVQRSRHGALYRARAILMREKSMVFAAMKGEGLKRLTDDEIAKTGYGVIRTVRRASSRGMKRLACVSEFEKLSSDAQTAHNTAMSVLGTLHQFTAPARVEKIEGAVREQKAALPSGKMLEMFR